MSPGRAEQDIWVGISVTNKFGLYIHIIYKIDIYNIKFVLLDSSFKGTFLFKFLLKDYLNKLAFLTLTH